MNKKLMIGVIAAFLSVTSVYAASEITGIEGVPGAPGGGNIFNIHPEATNGDVGYRHYDQFQLGQGDIANLLYQLGVKDIDTFINLVDGKIDINGIVNTMRGNNFYDGHAIFISPNGMVVGASGVLNVGSLSVVTPSSTTYNGLKNDYNQTHKVFDNINKISELKDDSNAAIDIKGDIIARSGIDLRGTDIDISGRLINGVNRINLLSDKAQADAVFNNLVNTDGMLTANAIQNGSLILIRSDNKDGAGINVSGTVANLDNGGVFLTNEGETGLTVGKGAVIASNDKAQLYNYNGDLNVNGTVSSKNNTLIVTNRSTDPEEGPVTTGANVNIGKDAKLVTDNEIAISNRGTGKLTVAGTTSSVGNTNITNHSEGGMEIAGNIGDKNVDTVRIVNYNGKMTFASGSDVNAGKVLQVENRGEDGLEIQQNAKLTSQENFGLKNKAGEMKIDGVVGVVDGDMNVWNEGNATKLTLASNGQINGNGNLSIKNSGANGMTLEGTLTNTGETAINNTNGQLMVNGVINNKGNMGIINKENGTGLLITQNGKIKNEGDLKIINSSGADGLTVVGDVENTGNMRVYNDNGHLTVANNEALTKQGSLKNKEGYMYIFSRDKSTGITTQEGTNISNEMGNLAIKHEGTTAEGERGMNLQGNISNVDGETAINNYSGDMYVSGNITVEDGNLGVINRQGGGKATFASNGKITQSGVGTTNIKNYGSGDMEVNNEITHEGRLNILGNTNHLYLGGQIHNKGNDYTYAASRENGTGLTASENFKVDGSGNVLIKNITGSDGLDFKGTIENKDGVQSALVNHKGDMNISGDITNTNTDNHEAPIIISNKGEGLNITENSTITNNNSEVKIVNTGSKEAQMNGTVKAPEGKFNFIEKLKNLLGMK